MNREIKFRGKRLDNGEWVYGASIISRRDWIDTETNREWRQRYFILDGDACNITPDSNDFVEVDPKTVGQYTGLKDKNGKEIYEGDVVKGQQAKNDNPYRRGVVFWHMDGWRIVISGVPRTLHKTAIRMEIIGNAHDNPEMVR